MKRAVFFYAVLISSFVSSVPGLMAQKHETPEKALEVASLLEPNLPEIKELPVKVEADWSRPYLLTGEGGGVLVVPSIDLTGLSDVKDGQEKGLGYLWMLKVAPSKNGKSRSLEELRMVDVYHEDNVIKLSLYTMSLRKEGEKLEMRLYGKDKKPLVKSTLSEYKLSSTVPLELDAEMNEVGADLYVHLFGTHRGTIKISEAESSG